MNTKLDPVLRSHVVAHGKALAARLLDKPPIMAKRLGVIVECHGSPRDLEAAGLETVSVIEHPTQHYKIITGSIPVDRLEDLAAIDHVVMIEGPRRMRPMLDYSVPQIHADVLRTAVPARTGKGVVVGIIDTGIDWRHHAFSDPDTGNSRILAIWDQHLPPRAGDNPPSPPFSYGVEYLNNQINTALQGGAAVRSLDSDKDDGHGTHVAGIAAGNGGPATCCHGGNKYIGVAPAASLIVVTEASSGGIGSDIAENQHIVDALNYIFTHPLATGKPVVVNISLGSNLGAHDGTSGVERAIDAILAGSSGRAVVVAAGNHGSLDSRDSETLSHARAAVPQAGAEIEFSIRDGYKYSAVIDVWYDRAGTLNLEVIADGGATTGVVNHGTAHAGPFPMNPGASAGNIVNLEIAGTINDPLGRDNHFQIQIHRPTDQNIPKSDNNWKLKFTNPNAAAVNLHCWIERGENQPVFLVPVDPPDGKIRASADSTLSIPSTAASAITVANHNSQTGWCDCGPTDGIDHTSGQGPVARNAVANPKPDIAAPGRLIDSTKADACNLTGNCCSCCPDACCFLYHDLSGTSMSAPHVTGTIALMLEANSTLTRDQILQLLQSTAVPPPPGGTPEVWGAGKLNALDAVNGAFALSPIGGGGGGGGGHIIHESFDHESRRAEGRLSSERGRPTASSPRMASPNLWLESAREKLEKLPDGVSLAASISRHFSEVRRLINHNRKIATMWHRTHGPMMLRRLLQCSCETNVPVLIATESLQGYFDRWCDLLMQHGSRPLQESLERHRSTIANFVGLNSDRPPVWQMDEAEAEAAVL
jgi:subtilisin family serine protease